MNIKEFSKRFLPVLIVLIIIILLAGFIIYGYKEYKNYSSPPIQPIPQPTPQEAAHEKEINRLLSQSMPPEDAVNIGRTNHFEGPQVMIHALEFMGFTVSESDQSAIKNGNIYIKGTQLSLDPDHPDWGLPNLRINVGPVEIYQPNHTIINKLLGGLGMADNTQHPYRIFRKRIKQEQANGNIKNSFLEIQLWLTEFHVNVSIIPDKKTKKTKGAKKITYPGKLYYSNDDISLAHLEPEYKNYRYRDVNIVLKLIPNNNSWSLTTSPQYKDYYVSADKPIMATAGCLCSTIDIHGETGRESVIQNLHPGSILTLYPDYQKPKQYNKYSKAIGTKDFGGIDFDPIENWLKMDDIIQAYSQPPLQTKFNEKFRPNTGRVIWDREQYVWIHIDNIGSWTRWEGLWEGKTKSADTIDYTFILPLFVIGNWDIKMPAGLTQWQPQAPVKDRGFGLIDLFPGFGFGDIGKYASLGFSVLLGIVLLFVLVPVVANGVKGFLNLFKK